MDEALKPVLERQMEVYAGFLEHTDYHVGRLIDTLETIGALENTLVYYIIGDNGASAEGTVNGAFNEMANFNGMSAIETPEFMASVKDKLGTVDAYNHYSVGWAWAMCTPYQWTKQVASHWGGTRNGTIVHWPAGITEQGRDCGPSSATSSTSRRRCWRPPGCRSRTSSTGCSRRRSRAPAWSTASTTPDAPERHDLQYFEMAGNRGIYFKGWSAVTRHSTPWLPNEVLPALDDDVWELYDGNTDWSQAHDLAAEQPDRLAKLQRLWLIEAVKYNVLPIDDRRFERLNATIAGRPQLITGTTPGAVPRDETAQREQRHRHQEPVVHRDRVDRHRRRRPDERGDHRAGRPVRRLGAVRQGRPGEVRLQPARHAGIRHRRRPRTLAAGSHQVRAEFAYDGGGLAKGGTVTLYYDGRSVGTGRVDVTQPLIFSADETTDIGNDYGMPVSADYAGASKFNGRIDVVQIDVGDDDHSHLIDPEQVARVAISRQ